MKKQLFAILGIMFAIGVSACNNSEPVASNSDSKQQSTSSSTESSESTSSSISSQSTSESSISSSVSSNSSSSSSSSASSSSLSSSSSSSSSNSSSVHVHNYGTLNEGTLPSYYYDGMKPHYYCIECGQYFDVDKNPTTKDALKLEKAGDRIALLINGIEKDIFENPDKNEQRVIWRLDNRGPGNTAVVALAKPGDTTYKYGFFAGENINENNTITIDGRVDFVLVATPNGLVLNALEHNGLVVKVNSEEYPLNPVTYLDGVTKTYIYGYHYFEVGDKMTVVDKDNNITYGYSDIASDSAWNKYDFHKGTNNEFVFDKAARFGIEFGRDGVNDISVTKTFGPSTGTEFAVTFNSERTNEQLTKHSYATNTEAYTEATWYVLHEVVINADDIKAALVNGYDMYTATVSFSSGEEFNLKDITNNAAITGDHLASYYGEDDCFTISGDYIKILKNGSYGIYYVPAANVIALTTMSAPGNANIMVDGAFVPLTKDANDNVTYTGHFDKNTYVVFTDDSYNMITPTLASGVDQTAVHLSSFLVYFDKAGTFKLDLNLNTNMLNVTVIELDDPGQQQGPITGAYLIGSGGMSARMENNPDNPDELMKKNVQMVASSGMVYVSIYNSTLSGNIEGVTLSEDSASVATAMSTLFYITAGEGTYDFYLNKNTLVLRIVKVS